MTITGTLEKKAMILTCAAALALGTAACGSAPAAQAPKPASDVKIAASTTVSHDFPRDPHCYPQLPCGPR